MEAVAAEYKTNQVDGAKVLTMLVAEVQTIVKRVKLVLQIQAAVAAAVATHQTAQVAQAAVE